MINSGRCLLASPFLFFCYGDLRSDVPKNGAYAPESRTMTPELKKRIQELAERYGANHRHLNTRRHFIDGAEAMFKEIMSIADEIVYADLKNTWCISYNAEVCRHADTSKKLADAEELIDRCATALEFANQNICKHGGELRPGNNRDWCHKCSSWVYESDLVSLKQLGEALTSIAKWRGNK